MTEHATTFSDQSQCKCSQCGGIAYHILCNGLDYYAFCCMCGHELLLYPGLKAKLKQIQKIMGE